MQTTYSRTLPAGRSGMPADAGFADDVSLINDDPRAAQVSTVTVDTATNSATYTFVCNGVTVTYTADSSTSKTEIRDGLTAAFNAEPLLTGSVTADADTTDVVTLTARNGGTGFTVSTTDANLTVATSTANAAASAVLFGAPIISDDASDNYGRALTPALIAQTQTITFGGTTEDSKVLNIAVNIDGVTTNLQYDTGSSSALDDTATEVAALLAPFFDDASAVGAVITIEEGVGRDFEVTVTGVGLSTTTIATAKTGSPLSTLFRGIALAEYDHENAYYSGGDVMSVRRQGRVCVDTTAAVSGDAVYYRVSDNTYHAAAASGLVRLPNLRFAHSRSATVAVVQVR